MNSFWLERIYTPQDENRKINLLIIISVLYKNIAQKSRIAISSNLTNSPFDFCCFQPYKTEVLKTNLHLLFYIDGIRCTSVSNLPSVSNILFY